MSNNTQTLELKVGRTYRAKKPGMAGGAYVNDRTILYIGTYTVQYDGPCVREGARYPTVDIADFQAWADRDVTDELPPGEYARWPLPRKARQGGDL